MGLFLETKLCAKNTAGAQDINRRPSEPARWKTMMGLV